MFLELIKNFMAETGFAALSWPNLVMLGIACVLLYLAIVKQYEPLLLLPISFGMLLANIPLAGLMDYPVYEIGKDGLPHLKELGGLLYYLYQGVKLGIYPPLIFMGVGAMTDFGPLLANPKTLFLGAAAQVGIFITLQLYIWSELLIYLWLGEEFGEAISSVKIISLSLVIFFLMNPSVR